MPRLGRTVLRALGLALVLVSLFTSAVFAGQSYLFCTMLERAVDECCCAPDPEEERAADGDVRTLSPCCHVNDHASPGSGVTPVMAPVLDANAVIASSAPVAMVTPALVYRRALLLPDWNGPPLEERRAKLQVFLL